MFTSTARRIHYKQGIGILFVALGLLGGNLLMPQAAQASTNAHPLWQQAEEPAYTVQPGDTLTQIANRYGLTIADLLRINGLQDRDFIYVGQQLIVAETVVVETAVDGEQANDETVSEETTGEETVTEETTTEDVATIDETSRAEERTAAETPIAIEEAVDTAAPDEPDPEATIEETTIEEATSEELTAAATPEATATPPVAALETTTYTVRPGDNLSRIARNFGTTLAILMDLNGLQDANIVNLGQVLTVPVVEESSTAEPTATAEEAATTDTSQEVEPLPTATPEPEPLTTTYTVRNGDNLSSVAVRFNTTTAELLQLNGLGNADYVYVGQRLTVPIDRGDVVTSVAPERINFAPGETSATVDGTLIFPEQACYIVYADAGQEMRVAVASDGDLANFLVRAADGNVNAGVPLKRLENESRNWSYTLPMSGDYIACVATPEGAAIYGLTIAIPVTCRSVTQAIQTVDWATFLQQDVALTHELIGGDDYVTVASELVSGTTTLSGIPQIDQIVYGDFDGDCQEEAALPLFSGGTAGNIGYLVYDGQTRDDGVTTPMLMAWGDGYKLAVAADNGILIISNALYNGWEPNCCPSGRSYDSYRLDEGLLSKIAATSEGYVEGQIPTVLHFYDLLQSRDYGAAYALLSPALQAANPYDRWVAGYAQTESIDATLDPDPDTTNRVVTDLRVTERLASGAARIRHYSGYWDLVWQGTVPSWILQAGSFSVVP